jgi:hypothetical protein
MQYIPEPVKEELRALINKLTDGRPQDYHREYRPRVDGPARWLLIKDGVIRFEIEVEWDAETEKRTNLVVRAWPPRPEQEEAAKKWCS